MQTKTESERSLLNESNPQNGDSLFNSSNYAGMWQRRPFVISQQLMGRLRWVVTSSLLTTPLHSRKYTVCGNGFHTHRHTHTLTHSMTLGCSTMQPCSGSEPYTWLVFWNTNFIFPNSWDDDPIWLSYFSRWLKPPTRDQKHIPNWSKNWGEEFCHIIAMVPSQLWHYPQHLPWKKLGRCSWKRRYPSRRTGRRTWKTSRVTWLFGLLRENSCWLIGALEHECYDFPIILGMSQCHHPNWPNPSFFRGIGVYHQPVLVPRCLAGEHPGIFPQRHEQFPGSWPIPPYPFGFTATSLAGRFFVYMMVRNGKKWTHTLFMKLVRTRRNCSRHP